MEIGQIICHRHNNHISIRRRDRKPFNPTWYEMQQLKNTIVGEDEYAIEIYPSQADLVDNNNFRHLWVVNKEDIPNLRSR